MCANCGNVRANNLNGRSPY